MKIKNNLASERRNIYFYYSLIILLFSVSTSCFSYNTSHMLDLGFSNTSIGIVKSFNSVICFIIPPVFGLIADKMQSTRKALLITIGINLIGFIIYPQLRSFFPFMVLTSLFGGTRSATNSLDTTLVVSELENCKKKGIFINYGSIRLWGSLGYSVVCILLNIMMTGFGLTIDGAFYICAGITLVMFITVLAGNRKTENDSSAKLKKASLSLRELKLSRLLKNYYYITYVIVFILIWLASCYGLNYLANLLTENGLPSSMMGILSGVRSGCEMLGFLFASKISKKLGPEKCIVTSGIAFTLEAFVFMFSRSFAVMIAGEVIHGLFDGLFMGVYATYLIHLVPRSLLATTQTLNSALANMVGMVFYLIGGAIVDGSGVRNVYYIAAAIPLAGVLIFIATLTIGRMKKIPRYDSSNDPVEQEILAKL